MAGTDPARTPPPATAGRLRGVAGSPVRDILALTERPGVISFAGGLPDPRLFDAAGPARRVRPRAARRRRRPLAAVLDDRGRPASCASASPSCSTARGLPTAADEVIVTSGSQQALTLVAALLLEPGVRRPRRGARLPRGAPGLPARRRAARARSRATTTGSIPEALEAAVARERPVLLYTVPTFQNPTGRTLPGERRREVARIAAEHGLWILEDDPYGELRYSGEPVAAHRRAARGRRPRARALDAVEDRGARAADRLGARAGRRAPPARHRQAGRRPAHLDGRPGGERDLARRGGPRRRTCGVCATVYGARRDALLDGLAEALPPGSTWNGRTAGCSSGRGFRTGWDAAELLRAAIARDVAFVPGAPFFAGPPDAPTLRLSFTTHPPAEIAEGLRRLRCAWA